MTVPRIGQTWKFKLNSGHPVIRTIKDIWWKVSESEGLKGRKIAMIVWSHTPKARYLPNYGVRALFHPSKQAKLLSSFTPSRTYSREDREHGDYCMCYVCSCKAGNS